tara:strand:+ start:17912 stop:18904 length:993 start_codon:yes stop_codon:yes gene_type:complete
MNENIFKALVIRKRNSSFSYQIETRKIKDLPPGDLLIRVNYSNINFKDMMSCLGNPSITRKFPHTPGIDACGVVVFSKDSKFIPGDNVVIVCQPMGLNTSGGFADFIRIPSSWAIKIDEKIEKKNIMAIGTAGLTGALAVENILNSNKIPLSRVIVTGATGGVGLVSITILKHLGINVTALTRSKKFTKQLESLGVDEIINYEDFIEATKQNLALSQWDAGIDVIGGDILSSLIKSIKPRGCVAVTGNVKSTALNTNVLPFILRGISLYGINAEMQKIDDLRNLIQKVNNDWMPKNLNKIFNLISLDELPEYMDNYIKDKNFGRLVVKVS